MGGARALPLHALSRFKGGHATAFGGQKYASLEEGQRRKAFAELLPWLRGQVSQQKRFIGTFVDDETILRFVNSHDAPRLAELGTSCPDHFLRTKIKPLYVPWDPATRDFAALRALLADGLAKYRTDYAAYYEVCAPTPPCPACAATLPCSCPGCIATPCRHMPSVVLSW